MVKLADPVRSIEDRRALAVGVGVGVTWDAQEDVFRFNALRQESATTKRSILSQAFSVWDPRRHLLPFLIRSKIILQNLNRLKYG